MDTITKHVWQGYKDKNDAIELITQLFHEHECVISDLEREKEDLEKKVEELEEKFSYAMEQILTLERAFQEGTQ